MKKKKINIPGQFKKQFRSERQDENNRKIITIPIAMIIVSILYLFQYKFAPGKENLSIFLDNFIMIFIAAIIISSVFLLLTPLFRKISSPLVNEIIQVIYSFMMFLFCIRFTVLDLQISTDYSSYTIGIFVLAFLLRISEWKFMILTLLGFIFYIINLFIINTSKLSAEVILPIIIISVLANFLVFSKERTRKKIFILKKDLEESAIKDPLTQLYNRRYMMEYLIKQVACYKRLKTDVSLLLIDIDFFKRVNDTLGHSVGDSVLTELSQILKKATRDTDLVTRYGGEEFIIILSNTGIETAFIVAERIRKNVEQFSFTKVPWDITVSIGISGLQNDDTICTLIDSADKNLYIAKEDGRNRIIST